MILDVPAEVLVETIVQLGLDFFCACEDSRFGEIRDDTDSRFRESALALTREFC